MPCQPTATIASSAACPTHASSTSPATGVNDHARARRHESGTGMGSRGRPTAIAVWRRPFGVSRLWKTGPSSSRTTSRSTPAARSASSSWAPAAACVHADDRGRRDAEPRRRECGVRHAAAESPAARVVRGDVARRGSDVDDLDRWAGHGTSGRILRDPHHDASEPTCSSTNSTRATTRSIRTSSS